MKPIITSKLGQQIRQLDHALSDLVAASRYKLQLQRTLSIICLTWFTSCLKSANPLPDNCIVATIGPTLRTRFILPSIPPVALVLRCVVLRPLAAPQSAARCKCFKRGTSSVRVVRWIGGRRRPLQVQATYGMPCRAQRRALPPVRSTHRKSARQCLKRKPARRQHRPRVPSRHSHSLTPSNAPAQPNAQRPPLSAPPL